MNILNIIFIKKKEKENDDNRVILKFIFENIGYFIIIFGALILNEIIIFNCFGLNENTYLKISDRGKIDSEYFEGLGPSSRNDEDDINTEEIGTDCDQTSNNS